MEELKRMVAKEALKYIDDDMIIGLGTGSTTAHFIQMLGKKLMTGELEDVYGIPTSHQSRLLALESGVPVVSLDEVDAIDLAIDGADEVDPHLNLIKGRGAALTMEKIIEYRAGAFSACRRKQTCGVPWPENACSYRGNPCRLESNKRRA